MLHIKQYPVVSWPLQDSICFAFFLTQDEYVEYWRTHGVTLKSCLQLKGILYFNHNLYQGQKKKYL